MLVMHRPPIALFVTGLKLNKIMYRLLFWFSMVNV